MRARSACVHAGARVAPSPVALIIEQICVVCFGYSMSGSRNVKTCKTLCQTQIAATGPHLPFEGLTVVSKVPSCGSAGMSYDAAISVLAR